MNLQSLIVLRDSRPWYKQVITGLVYALVTCILLFVLSIVLIAAWLLCELAMYYGALATLTLLAKIVGSAILLVIMLFLLILLVDWAEKNNEKK